MRILPKTAGFVAVAFIGGTAGAETMRSHVSFNTAVQQKAPDQPPDGIAVTYPVAFSGGELDGCTAQIAESLFPRDNGNWGIFQVEAEVTCAAGVFGFTSSGSWDDNGFHGSGRVKERSGSGTFDGLDGRVAQIAGKIAPAITDGTFDVEYELRVDRAGN